MTGLGDMATPLHHDQPHRALRNLGINSEEPTEISNSSRHMRKRVNSPPQHDENLANQPGRSASQLPPRPGHHRQSQQHLRQRRPESSSPHGPLEESSRHTPSSDPHIKGFFEEYRPSYQDHPHTEISPESNFHYARSFRKGSRPDYQDNPHAGCSPEGHSHHADPVVSMSNNETYGVHEEEACSLWQPNQAELQSAGASTPTDHHHVQIAKDREKHQALQSRVTQTSCTLDYKAAGASTPTDHHHVQSAKEREKHQALQSRVTQTSCTLDYKAAVLRGNSGIPASNHLQHVNHDNYFGSTKDDKHQSQSKDSLFEQQQCVIINSCDVRHGETPHKVTEQNESISQIPCPAQATHEDQAETNVECDPVTSEPSLQAERCFQPLQRELSHSSSDDGFCHISKEAVEQEYQNECHLAAPSEDQAQSQAQPPSRIIYDYARAGVTLVEDSPNEEQSDDLCSNKEGLSNSEEAFDNHSAHDDQRGLDSQHQDVESPPLFLGFNHSSTRFACGTSKGLRVYDINTMVECFNFVIGGVGLVEMLSSTVLILVGGGPNPSYPLNQIVMWDAIRGSTRGQISHKFPILAVKAQYNRLVVVLENEVYVYNMSNAKLLFQVSTASNIKGLCALSTEEGSSVMACPGLKKGEVRIEYIGATRTRGEMPTRDGVDVLAHDSGLACIALNPDGSLLATASNRGTLVRIFNAKDGTPLQELRRGSDRAEIYSLAFSFSSDWLAVSSDKGTVHIFGLRTVGSNSSDSHGVATPTSARNLGSTFSFIKGVLPKYFSSEWSFAQFKLPEEMKSVVAFGQDKHSVLVLGTNGSFYKGSFDPEQGGDMKQLEFWNFLKSREAEA